MRTTIHVPATTANLGPGFDCLGLALDLWNEFEFTLIPGENGQAIEIRGFGETLLPGDRANLVLRAFNHMFERSGTEPPGLRVRAQHGFPIASGLGSSASAIAAGVLAAAAFAGAGSHRIDPFAVAVEIEGHPDNVSAALAGGLTISLMDGSRPLTASVPVDGGWCVGVVVPELAITTAAMRRALPDRVPFQDAVFNLGRTAMVVRAFESGEDALLKSAMQDRLHQPSRLPLIQGAETALAAAAAAGAAAALSGAGPGLIAFSTSPAVVRDAVEGMRAVFEGESIGTWSWQGGISREGSKQVTVTG